MGKPRFLALLAALWLAACASSTEIETIGGAKAFLSDPVAVDIIEAQFNIPFLLSQIDGVRRSLRDNGSVVQETYYAGESRVAVVKHVFDAWFNQVSISSAQDETAFHIFLERTPMRSRQPEVHEAVGPRTYGFLAYDGECVAFRFLRRVKNVTGFENDTQNPDTFVAGYTCDADGVRFVELFGFMSPDNKARLDRRNSI